LKTPEFLRFHTTLKNSIDPSSWKNPCAVTLTLKLAISNNGMTTELDPIKASENLRHFQNRLNRSLVGRGYPVKRKGVPCLAVYEGTSSVRPHYHLCLERPERVPIEAFTSLIQQHWSATHWGYHMTLVEPCSDIDGWVHYMIKRRSKSDFASSIDWINTNGCVAKSCL